MSQVKAFQDYIYRLLRWSERYTKTDMVYLTQGGFWLALGQVVQIALGFSSAVVFANFLSPELYGNFRYVLSMTAIISSFSLSGVSTAVSAAAARGNDGALSAGFNAILTWSWIMVIVGATGATYYFIQNNTLLGIAMLMAGIANPILVAATVYDAFFEGKKLFRIRVIYSLLRNAIPMLLVIATVITTVNLFIILAVYFIANTASAYFLYRSVLKRQVQNTANEEGTVRYGMHVSFINFLGTITTNIDRILLFQMIGATPLAVFSFAQSPLNYTQTGFQMLKTMMFPKFASKKISEIHSGAHRKIIQLSVVALCVTGIYILLAPFFFHTFFPQYSSSIPYSQVMVLTTLATPTIVFAQTLLAHKRQRELYIVRITTLIAKILFLVGLIPFFGLWGAIYATLATKVIESSALTYFFWKLRDQRT
jgi:O-antigen/teichoic acid export membrane protein